MREEPALNLDWDIRAPAELNDILGASEAAGFGMASDRLTGALLRVLAASKPAGFFLELGTGAGAGAAWLLAGMDKRSTLDTVDNDAAIIGIAKRFLAADPRIRFHCADGAEFLASLPPRKFDLIFADTWPGKYTHLDEALSLLKPGGLYVADDLLPQPNWTPGHALKIPLFLESLERRPELHLTRLAWSTGIVIATKMAQL